MTESRSAASYEPEPQAREKFWVQCSRCQRMVAQKLRIRMSDIDLRCFTCARCHVEIKGSSHD